MSIDAQGRSTTKPCPECARTLGRTARLCPGCGHTFVGRQWEQRKRMRESGITFKPGEPAPVLTRPAQTATQCAGDDFDCIAAPDGGLDLMLTGGTIHLDARAKQIVAIEIALST